MSVNTNESEEMITITTNELDGTVINHKSKLSIVKGFRTLKNLMDDCGFDEKEISIPLINIQSREWLRCCRLRELYSMYHLQQIDTLNEQFQNNLVIKDHIMPYIETFLKECNLWNKPANPSNSSNNRNVTNDGSNNTNPQLSSKIQEYHLLILALNYLDPIYEKAPFPEDNLVFRIARGLSRWHNLCCVKDNITATRRNIINMYYGYDHKFTKDEINKAINEYKHIIPPEEWTEELNDPDLCLVK